MHQGPVFVGSTISQVFWVRHVGAISVATLKHRTHSDCVCGQTRRTTGCSLSGCLAASPFYRRGARPCVCALYLLPLPTLPTTDLACAPPLIESTEMEERGATANSAAEEDPDSPVSRYVHGGKRSDQPAVQCFTSAVSARWRHSCTLILTSFIPRFLSRTCAMARRAHFGFEWFLTPTGTLHRLPYSASFWTVPCLRVCGVSASIFTAER